MRLKKKSIMAESDRVLIQGCRNGNPAAWERLLDKYERLVFSIPVSYGLSQDDAADVMQLTFASLVRSLDRLQEDSRLGAWLVTVARHHTWRLLGRNRRETASAGVVHAEEAVLLSNDGAGTVEHWELAEWLNHGLSMIGKPCRDLLFALYFDLEQPTYAEVAARLNMPVGSIGPTRARCLQRLKRVLGDP
jgi:RNA polymerase sigma factor (sigma-70 family)